MKTIALLLVLVSSLLASANPVYAKSCETLFHSSFRSIGELNQNDPVLRRARLFPFGNQNRSMLCGPVCLINLVHEIREDLGSPHRPPYEELTYLLKDFAPWIGVRTNSVRNDGMTSYGFAHLARHYLQHLKITARIKILGVEIDPVAASPQGRSHRTDISIDDLTVNQKRFVIINYEGWRTDRPDLIEAGNGKTGWLGGHYVILDTLSRDGERAAHATFHDPALGRREGYLLETFDSKGLGIETLRVIFPETPGEPPRDQRVLDLVTNIVVIEID